MLQDLHTIDVEFHRRPEAAAAAAAGTDAATDRTVSDAELLSRPANSDLVATATYTDLTLRAAAESRGHRPESQNTFVPTCRGTAAHRFTYPRPFAPIFLLHFLLFERF